MIGVQKVPETSRIQVHDIGDLMSDYLALCFERINGVEDADVELCATDDYAIVRFADSSGKNCLHVFVCHVTRRDLWN